MHARRPNRIAPFSAIVLCAGLTACGGQSRREQAASRVEHSQVPVSPSTAAPSPSPDAPIAVPDAVDSNGAASSGAAAMAGVPASFAALTAFDGRTGAAIAWDDLIARCIAANVVVIGEEHDLNPAQMMAADLFSAILARRSDAVLSLEFFERDEQVHLDDYIDGLTTDEQFVAATGRREGNYPDGHRAMIAAAKAAGAPVIASNAPRRYVRLARLEGYDRLRALNEAQRALFVIPSVMPSGHYRDEFIGMMSAMGAHGPEGAAGPQPSEEQRRSAAEATFRSQAMWDATMADSIVRALRDGARPVVHVVGRFHVDHDGGTLQLLRRARPSARVLTISCGRGTSAALLGEDRGRADIVVYADDPPASTEPSPTDAPAQAAPAPTPPSAR